MRKYGLAIALLTMVLWSQRLEASSKGGDPAVQKMKETIRNTMIQLRDANIKLATAQAAQAEAEEKVKELQGKLDELTKKTSEEKKKDNQTIEDQQKRLAHAEEQSAHLSESLKKWKDGYAKLAAYAKETASKRSELASAVVVLNRQIADQRSKNAEMYKTAQEILDRYAKFGLGTAITAREPFVGISRVKLENLVQEYDAHLTSQTIRSNETAAKASHYEAPQNAKVEMPESQ